MLWFRALLVVAVLVAGLVPGTASAHRYEMGISIEPAILALPAVADENTKSTLSFGGGGGLGIEYYVLGNLALVVRGGYAHAFATSHIGAATFDRRQGNYYFQQSAGYAFGGLRLETPSHWLPVTFFVSALAGIAILPQTQRQLLDDAGRDYGLNLPDVIKPVPAISASIGLSGRVTNQIRLQFEPTMYLFPVKPVLIGFGFTIGITFLFFT